MRQRDIACVSVVFICLLIMIFLVGIFAYSGMNSLAKSVKDALDMGQATIEIKDIAFTDQAPVSDNGNFQTVTLSPGMPYTVVLSATGDNCNYHYSGEKDLSVKGTKSRDMIVPETAPGHSVVHTLSCKSAKGTNRTTKMLMVKIASSKTGTPVAATAMQ